MTRLATPSVDLAVECFEDTVAGPAAMQERDLVLNERMHARRVAVLLF